MTDERSTQLKLTVVVVAWTGREPLRLCLRSLLSQVHPEEDEIIVARNFADDDGRPVHAEFSTVTDFRFARDMTVPKLRAAGFAAAKGNVIAFLEDHCVCVPGWRDAIMSAHELSVDAVGGPVDLSSGGLPLDWAVYFYDYSRFAPPLKTGPVPVLSGANMSFKRKFLVELGTVLQDGVTEVTLEQESRRRGASIHMAGGAAVIHGKRHSAENAISLAFALARGYASQRVHGKGRIERLVFACATPVLPILFMGRILGSILRARHNVIRFAIASPWLIVLLYAWSFGEFAGYLAGKGDSDRKWS